jgi:hypothetical protein
MKIITLYLSGRDESKESVKPVVVLLFFVFLLFGASGPVTAQDMIVLKTGEEIKSTVSEVSTDLINYQNGSAEDFRGQAETLLPVVQATSISLQPLEFRGTVRQGGKPLRVREVRKLMTPYPDALHSFNSGQTLSIVTRVMCIVGLLYELRTVIGKNAYVAGSTERKEYVVRGYSISFGIIVSALVPALISNSKVKTSVKLYNSSINKPITYKVNFGLQENGIGVALKF